jgi:hypothetical protein
MNNYMWLVEGTTYNCNVNRPSCRDALIEEKEDMKDGLFGWLVADGWCWFVLREEYCWLVAAGCWWLVRSERKVLLAGG